MPVRVSDVELGGEVVGEGVIIRVIGGEGEGGERGIINGDFDVIRDVDE